MDLRLTEEQEMTRGMARELAAREIAPIAAEIDETGRFPRQVFGKMAQAGLFGILVPPPFGGAGGDRLDWLLIIEEISAASAAVGWCFATSTLMGFAILAFGNDAQKKKYLPVLAKGERLAAFALVEPGGGTNWPMTLRTRAVADGDQYVVSGSKCFTSNAGEADIYVVMTRTDPAKGPMGFSTLIVENGTPGFSFGTKEDKFGLRADPTGELFFEDCRVPRENLLGPEGGGLSIFQAVGAPDCVAHAGACVGIAEAALGASVKYAKERTVVEPGTLAHFENVQRAIADMTIAVEAARLVAYRAALPAVEKGPDPLILLAAMFCNQVAMEVSGKAVELHGGHGCTRDFPVGLYFRDAKTLSLQKTSEYVRTMAGKMLLGIPTGPPPGAGGPPR
jgi:alkylation response protein AidB-like acyl-CoA dehydrogenase